VNEKLHREKRNGREVLDSEAASWPPSVGKKRVRVKKEGGGRHEG